MNSGGYFPNLPGGGTGVPLHSVILLVQDSCSVGYRRPSVEQDSVKIKAALI